MEAREWAPAEVVEWVPAAEAREWAPAWVVDLALVKVVEWECAARVEAEEFTPAWVVEWVPAEGTDTVGDNATSACN